MMFTVNVLLKPQSNDRNMPMQHVAYVWPPCCDVLRDVGCC